jgi:hypothetical protein
MIAHFLAAGFQFCSNVKKVDPATGAHALVKELAPADRTGGSLSRW